MGRKYRIGVIGTGARASAFAPQLHEAAGRAELFGLCDVDHDRLDAFIEKHKLAGVRKFTDFHAMLAEKDMDAVVVTAPEFVHREICVAAMKAGKPIYLEKPIAHTLEDAYAMLEAQRRMQAIVFVGFNLRASPAYNTIRRIVRSGTLGQIIHIEGIEQLHVAHIASFMRRFHRHSSLNGGLLNTKCCHDLDILNWIVGHEHRIVKVSSFGGLNIFLPEKQPGPSPMYCRNCPIDVYQACPYKAPGSDDLRSGKVKPPPASDHYPGDLCVYTPDKDLVDNQTVIMEWDNGVRGNFNLQGFQHDGDRMMRIWGERGTLTFEGQREPHIQVKLSEHGDLEQHHFQVRRGGHGGTDNQMIDRFIDAIESGGASDSGLSEGLAASLVAIKADEARHTGRCIEIPRDAYDGPVA